MRCTLALLAVAMGLAGPCAGASAAEARRSSAFLATLGVNTHLNYTDGGYADYRRVIADLDYLGIRLVRDAVPNPWGGIPFQNDVTALDALAAAGVRFDMLASPGLSLEARFGVQSCMYRAYSDRRSGIRECTTRSTRNETELTVYCCAVDFERNHAWHKQLCRAVPARGVAFKLHKTTAFRCLFDRCG